MQHKLVRLALAILEGFGALTAIAGGIALMMGEIQFPLAWLQGTPFSDYTIPGLVLFLVVGGGMLLAVTTVFLQREGAVLISMAVGLFMMAFEAVEVASVDSKVGEALALALLLQVFYFVLGLTIFGLATYLWWAEFRGHSFLSRHLGHV
jgi:hypothetical protein